MPRAGRTALSHGAIALLCAALLIAAACGSSSANRSSAPPARAEAAVGAAIDTVTQQLGARWRPPGRPWFADETITDRCGEARTGLAAPVGGLVASGTSPMLTPISDEPPDGTPAATGPVPTGAPSTPPSTEVQARDRYGNVRISVLVYADEASARAALGHLTPTVLAGCFVEATNRYLDRNAHRASLVPDATAQSFATTSTPIAVGDEATLTEIQFDEDVLGGTDNTHNAALLAGRSGPVVVTALAVSNQQGEDPGNPTALARTIGGVALERAATPA